MASLFADIRPTPLVSELLVSPVGESDAVPVLLTVRPDGLARDLLELDAGGHSLQLSDHIPYHIPVSWKVTKDQWETLEQNDPHSSLIDSSKK